MNYKKITYFIISCLFTILIHADGSASLKKISLNYENEDLVNVINYVAAQKNLNVILPMKADQKITGKFTWQLDKKVTVDEAWDLLSTILDIAGYSIIPKAEYHEIVKTTKDVIREPVPLYVGTSLEELPPSDQRIRYIYYFSNIKLHQGEGREAEITTLLKTLLNPETSSFKIDGASNSILLLAPSTDVYSIMQLISQLDRPGFQEKLEIVPLHYANSSIVADLFNKKILLADQQGQYHLGPVKNNDAQYFSKNIRIVANDRTNALIMVGRLQAVERVKEFINNYIDVKPESGDSILHVYQLQYLDAASFAEVLNNIVQSKTNGGTEQSTGTAAKGQGPERYFEGVVIAVDTPKQEDFKDALPAPSDGKERTLPAPKYYGGNNLIIAARGDDWKRIKTLIEELDKPKPQVLIEVLIVDLTLNDNRALGNMFRNAAKLSMPGEFNIQSAQLNPGVIPDSFNNPQTIGVIPGVTAADEARLFLPATATTGRQDAVPGQANATSIINGFDPGTTAITLNDADGKTWSIARILNALDQSKILSHPHVISTHNKEASIENTTTRILQGDTSSGTGGAVVQKQVPVDASLKVKFRPRISSAQEGRPAGTVNLQISIDIDEYTSNSNDTRVTRNVTTNATINSGDILAIGGLIRTEDSDSIREMPILSKIPIIGWLFKNKDKGKRKTNLTVFISPTIIEPRLRGGINKYTEDYLGLQKSFARQGDLFDSLKDPITRWFFKSENPTEKLSEDFMKNDDIHTNGNSMVPMPGTTQPTHGTRKRKSAIGLEVAQTKPQAEKLKGLLENIDNPFNNKKIATLSTQPAVIRPQS